MKQSLSLTPSTDELGLDPFFAGAPVQIYGTIPAYPVMDSWQMQLWKYPSDAGEEGAEPLLTAVGAEATGVMTITFTASQLSSLDLSDAIGCNNYWLTLGGVDENSQRRVVRGGTVEIIPCPFVTDAGATVSGITITDDVASFVYNGQTYTLPVAAIETPVGAVEGEIVVIDDMAVLTIDGVSYTFPVQES
jgi:hypothetical protein